MLAHEDQVMWQRGEAQLVAQFEALLQNLVAASDSVQTAIDPVLLSCGPQGDKYRAALEAARAQLTAVKDHRRRFADAAREASDADGRSSALAGGKQTQNFGVLQHGSNWREMRGVKR